MPSLRDLSITFHTHNQGKDPDTVVHVFVKNRLNTTAGSDQNTTFISNLLASQRYLEGGDLEDHASSPYLGYRAGIAANEAFDDPSDNTFFLNLMPQQADLADIVLPAVDIHILPHGNNRWIFDYTVTFTFDDADQSTFKYSSKDDGGLPGIILDQDNRDYSGICAENPLALPPVPDTPVTNATLRNVTLEFITHDDDKNPDTRLDIEVLNRLGADSFQQIAAKVDAFHGQHFDDDRGVIKTISWPGDGGGLNGVSLADMVLPVVNISIDAGQDRWIFDYRLTLEFADNNDFKAKSVFYRSTTSGVILDQDNNKHSGVYQGPSFPTVAARPAPTLTAQRPDLLARTKTVPLALVRQKFDEFINNRNGSDTNQGLPPLRKIRLDNSGVFNDDAFPESYLDVRSITPGTGTVNYVSSPTSLGQLDFHGITNTVYFRDVNSDALTISVDSAQPTIFTFGVHFETGGPEETAGLFDIDFLDFSISVKLTLVKADTPDGLHTVVDVLNWITELENLDTTRKPDHFEGTIEFFHYTGTLLGQPVDFVDSITAHDKFIDDLIHVILPTSEKSDPGGFLRQEIRDNIFDRLTKKDQFTGRTPREDLNSTVTSWLLGGIADDDVDVDGHNAVITDVGLGADGDSVVITYTGPQNVFTFQTPADWPTSKSPNPAWDLSPGTLSNIDHIVVLTMENRSFDHMLGYLSLPVAQGGMGRTDVDGLKGGESNSFRGTPFPSAPVPGTVFSPFPPHGFEPVHRAINGGKMDGFASEYAAQNGTPIAGQVMQHQTASTVPVYDGLARDFAVGHRWFASHPGPTFPNRFYELTGRLNLDVRGFWEFDPGPVRPVGTQTIFDFLSGAKDPVTGLPQPVSWTYFEQGYNFLRLFERHTFDNDNIVSFEDPDRGFRAMARAGTLPSVSFIDPHFVELPPGSNDDDSPSDIQAGQDFVRRVVEAVVTSPAWTKTLLLIVYDEHGGFYDHVAPSQAAKVSPDLPIDTHGVRVPALVISPWVAAGTVFGGDTAPARQGDPTRRRNDLHFDHTSILRTIARRFLSADPPYLGTRYAAANDLSAVVGTQLRLSQFLPFIRYNVQDRASQMMLGIKDANPAPGAQVWQLPTDGSTAQDFSFEDAGHGFFYIRSHVSGLYLTLHAATPASAADGGPDAADAPGPIPVPRPIPPVVIQDVKFVPGTTSAGTRTEGAVVPLPEVARQQWSFVPTGSGAGPDLFTVQNRAAAGMVLQPADPTQPGPVVLRAVPPGTPLVTFAWKVTSPALTS
jgi:Phosphoesterase family/Ricin-type beta-trefoil lectin domain-like